MNKLITFLVIVAAITFSLLLMAARPPKAEAAVNVSICHNGTTLTIPLVAALLHLAFHENDTPGPCPVVPTQNGKGTSYYQKLQAGVFSTVTRNEDGTIVVSGNTSGTVTTVSTSTAGSENNTYKGE